jgi:hypothetical protein
MHYVRTGKKLLLIFGNVIKAYESDTDGQPQDKDPNVNGYITQLSFIISIPSYEVEILPPLEDCFDEHSQKPLMMYRSPEYILSETMSVAQDRYSLGCSLLLSLPLMIKSTVNNF